MNELSKGEVIVYQTKDGQTEIGVKFEKDDIWLTQKQMSKLFGTSTDNIGLHLKNIFKSRELEEKSVAEEYSVTASDGKIYKTKHYRLDAIISVGYRVNSIKGTRFRQWATKTLKEHLEKGMTFSEYRIRQIEERLDIYHENIQLANQHMVRFLNNAARQTEFLGLVEDVDAMKEDLEKIKKHLQLEDAKSGQKNFG
jgi:hypothetical protein